MAHPLLEGFATFRKQNYADGEGIMPRLVSEGQTPEYFIVSCIDSRSNPGTVFQTEPGTFFAHKAMGAIVRPYTHGTALAAALQFALEYNKVTEIIVLGHTSCGAVKALIERIDDEEIFSFVDVARKGLKRAEEYCAVCQDHGDLSRHAEEQIVLLSAENLKTYPSVVRAIAENRVVIRAWLFDMTAGSIQEFSTETQRFETISDAV